WPQQFVTEHALTVAIYQLRKALGDGARTPRFIETIRQRGYRWLPAIALLEPPEPATTKETLPDRSADAELPVPRWAILQPFLAWPVSVAVTALLLSSVSWWSLQATGILADSGHRIRSLAVLPLADLSPEADGARFAESMTESMVTALVKLGSVELTSRTTIRQYRNHDGSANEIAGELGVDALLTGSIMRSENRVRIMVQLIDGETDTHLWAESYEHHLDDVWQQWDLAGAIAGDLNRQLRSEVMNVADSDP
ncbi:MAG: hypothetical protein GY856_37180, partial [bacterium]|nr:hypothetical protein [bacterium]